MKTQSALILCTLILSQAVQAATSVIPGTSDPWLAGMPDGTIGVSGGGYPDDSAPAESPVLVTGITINPGQAFYFSGTGLVGNDSINGGLWGLDGDINNITPHLSGDQNGIAGFTAPVNCLVGIFLGPNQPDLGVAPSALDFTTSASRNYLTLNAVLQQPFFIGDGLTDSSIIQGVIAPAGATRLYLGTMDGAGWYNNRGSFTVSVVPEPNTLTLLAGGALILARTFKQRKSNVA